MGLAEALAQSAFLGGLADAALSDLRRFRIPNRDPLLLLAAFAAAAVFSRMPAATAVQHLAAGGVVFVAGALLFAARVWGGGDAKLLAAVAVWCGFAGLARVVVVTVLAGGLLAVAVLVLRLLSPKKGRRRLTAAHLPYGVAIAAGALMWWWGVARPAWGG